MSKVLNGNLDALKVLLAVFVVVLHCHFMGGNYTTVGYLLCNGLFRVAVPTFFVINGYYLWKTLDGGHSFAVWFKRGLLLYLFWMLVYSPTYVSLEALGSVGGVLWIVKQFVIGYFHLWYLLGMLGGGLILFLLRGRPTALLVVLALAAFTIGLVLQYARVYFELPNAFLQHFNQNDYTARNFLFMGFPFMALGFLLARHQVPERVTRPQVCAALVVSLVLVFAEAWLNYSHQADARQNFDFLLSLPLITPALFLLPFVFFRASTSSRNAKLSSALYYVHPLFLYGALSLGIPYGNLMTAVVLLLALAAAPLLILLSRRLRFVL
ncbi:acyltransferase family protein [Pseudomonas vanderleydeniana]|uniref:Acyltransferase family protein n=1 Tax=Pseudomonas vanderleydeniana TaxID=2745495 RepID=A0A9E6PI57_9PSED|nr:acyltransferase family protein [Pseudomonas vanderleydeniana]QXI26944.1 acyltransferase family protein [Pseudomonas vanderleydeniana]